jgi:sortase A
MWSESVTLGDIVLIYFCRLFFSMTKRDIIIFIALRTLGNFLLLLALYGVAATFGPAFYYEVRYQFLKAEGIRYLVSAPAVASSRFREKSLPADIKHGRLIASKPQEQGTSPFYSFLSILAENKTQIIIPVDTEFSITIPKIDASARIFPNVDPNDPSVYLPVLQKGIAHAKGSVFPGMQGNVYLFAHSTDNWWDVGRYNAVFYLLKDLSIGDDIIVFFENRRYDYAVTKTIITAPTDISLLTQGEKGGQYLVLQTCWPPGTSLERLYVIAEPIPQ